MYYAQQDLGIGIGLKDLDEFSENLQMSFDPPAAALVSKNYVALFFGRYRNLQRYISDSVTFQNVLFLSFGMVFEFSANSWNSQTSW